MDLLVVLALEESTGFQKRSFTPAENLQKALTDAREWMMAQTPPISKSPKPSIRPKPNPRRSGQYSVFTDAAWNSRVREYAGTLVKPGVSTDEIDEAVYSMIIENGAYPSPLGYGGDKEVTKESLEKAISICGPGVEYKKIGKTIHDHADKHKYGVVRQFVGHGIGRVFHADPVVLYLRNNEAGRMVLNQTFTIEPMLTIGSIKPVMWDDNWTVVTEDASLSAQFEHTILITKDGAEILTNC
ncbi:PREDICTED: methionine aminopeptidase 1D, chloroplastic/mitochondrial-like [Brassica oleracea var. oleracea]|uniref:methionine aminopeptidase 1D, chloroplastic/mitochondrial-like n=1 Tax=Brassica oleracea var. oleracea TaxID=109376 RepID=UPI0006A6D83E|nr:PREDICTED: methionine aminopeptidase 1D, chloroplastic/mitochondrial-like [Brassica oleracea var. oleracea]